MKTALIALISLAGLTACDPTVTSLQPLITAGPETVRPGLWAMLEEGCATPVSAVVQTWPVCATPFWVGPGDITYLLPSPIRTPYLLSSGRPMIVQQRAPNESELPKSMRTLQDEELSDEPSEYGYMAVQPEGASPFLAGRLWNLGCPKPETPSITGIVTDPEEPGCRAETLQGLRTFAARVTSAEKGRAIVWVAPA